MTCHLLRSLSRLERRTQRLLDNLCTWTPERLQLRPSLESWSALDLIDHLMRTVRAVLATMRSNLSAGNDVTLRDRYRNAVILRNGRCYKDSLTITWRFHCAPGQNHQYQLGRGKNRQRVSCCLCSVETRCGGLLPQSSP